MLVWPFFGKAIAGKKFEVKRVFHNLQATVSRLNYGCQWRNWIILKNGSVAANLNASAVILG
jgi:hypothetical protein